MLCCKGWTTLTLKLDQKCCSFVHYYLIIHVITIVLIIPITQHMTSKSKPASMSEIYSVLLLKRQSMFIIYVRDYGSSFRFQQ